MTEPVERVASQLEKVVEGKVWTHKNLAPYTSYKIGGPARFFVAPRTGSGVSTCLRLAHEKNWPLFVLGCGTNLLISDAGWPGIALYIGNNLSGCKIEDTRAEVLAGTRLQDLIQEAVGRGLAGMEQMAGIPGGIGGALKMNAGAFGQEIKSTTVAVEGYRLDGSAFKAAADEMDFRYRHVPALEDVVITSARFRFSRQEPETLQRRKDDILRLRAKRQPLEFPSCGSIFKRPAGYYAGALIEEAGLKGTKIGGAMVSRKHAGFILNVDKASANDILALIRRIENSVLQRFGVRLEREVRLIGEFQTDRQ